MKKFKIGIVAIAAIMLITSCNTLTHTVGEGAKGSTVVQKKQWYVLFGLVPLNNVDSKVLAGGAKDYTVKTQNNFIDYLISIVAGIVTVHSATVTVTK